MFLQCPSLSFIRFEDRSSKVSSEIALSGRIASSNGRRFIVSGGSFRSMFMLRKERYVFTPADSSQVILRRLIAVVSLEKKKRTPWKKKELDYVYRLRLGYFFLLAQSIRQSSVMKLTPSLAYGSDSWII